MSSLIDFLYFRRELSNSENKKKPLLKSFLFQEMELHSPKKLNRNFNQTDVTW